MEPGRTTRESLDPAEFLEISAAISDIRREREQVRHRKLEERRAGARAEPVGLAQNGLLVDHYREARPLRLGEPPCPLGDGGSLRR